MGLLVQQYVTAEGFTVTGLYVQVQSMRILKTLNGSNYVCAFTCSSFKSQDDMVAGARSIPVPTYLETAEVVLRDVDFYKQTLFGYAYDSIKANWVNAGYTVEDLYPHPPTPTTYTYDCSGYNIDGFNCSGFDHEGYDRNGFNAAGYDRQGYDVSGLNTEGFDKEGYGVDGYTKEGYDREGYDRNQYTVDGFDREGYDRNGFDMDGCNRDHKDKDGNFCPAGL